ncbi:hypothetical protein IscW_ISCW003548 [Ixodes scapularis]|uniref:Uncharacterized protein n=1 Tax=Ixodes scapularis TaxID=6945 RepID=B7PJV0_IXOSC|nr:hypothetical protein IscW_ISCW003548 [Ixodes scapularis]|eukprot:XP_002408689.1 hypothetical protein IscW_ISCW003548 [Ixodes scapularis]
MTASEESDRQLEEYVAFLIDRCPGLDMADELYTDLRYTSSMLSFNYINFKTPCTGTDALRCGIFEELTVWNEFLSILCVELKEVVPGKLGLQAFGQLAACRHVVELTIFLEQEIDDASALLLARFLASTKTLKEVFLRFGTEASSTRILLEGLSCNKSISKLSLMYWSFDRLESELALALQNITTLNYLSLYSMDTLFVYSIVRDLARCLKKHYSLIVVDINVNGKSKEHEFGIREPLRRNLSLLQQAAQFATGTRNKRSADMFERLFRSEALVWKVQQLSRNTEAEARKMIKNSIRYLDVNFMAATGVVKEAVVCFGTGDGKMQLDQIGLDNWLRIRSYLRVSDIRDEGLSVCSKSP